MLGDNYVLEEMGKALCRYYVNALAGGEDNSKLWEAIEVSFYWDSKQEFLEWYFTWNDEVSKDACLGNIR